MSNIKLPNKACREDLGDKDLDILSKLIYNPLTGLVYKKRFELVASLIPPCNKLLEIGYGAGMLFTYYEKVAGRSYGIEIHGKEKRILRFLEKVLGEEIERVALVSGAASSIPFRSESFECVVCMSVLEHFRDVTREIVEIHRVLKNDGSLILGVPIKNLLTKVLFRLVGYDDDRIHPSSDKEVLTVAKRQFKALKIQHFPMGLPHDLSLYCVAKLVKVAA